MMTYHTGIKKFLFILLILALENSLSQAAGPQICLPEDLHFGIGRKRKKSSIGIHDLDTISFPLVFTTTTRNHQFSPLNSTEKNSISEILEKTQVGQDYGHILGNSPKVPIIIDSVDNTVSFPPIINSSVTTVTTKTKNLFVEVTGIDKNSVEDMLSVVATILQFAGFELHQVTISGAKNSTPQFKDRKITLNGNLANDVLGLKLSLGKTVSSLKKCRLNAVVKSWTPDVPVVLSEMLRPTPSDLEKFLVTSTTLASIMIWGGATSVLPRSSLILPMSEIPAGNT